ncbi:MAG: hypothetical protein ACYCST_20865, partial [Acidimicrobiales bacterium]
FSKRCWTGERPSAMGKFLPTPGHFANREDRENDYFRGVLEPPAAPAAPPAVFLRTTSLGTSSSANSASWTAETLPPGLGVPSMISCPNVSTCVAVAPDGPLGTVVLGAGTIPGTLASSPRVTATSTS